MYEILYSYPFATEQVEIPFTVNPPGAAVTAAASFAPFYSSPEAGRPNAALPEPRFADLAQYTPCVTGPCISATPAQGRSGETVNVAISGGPILNGAQVKLTGGGGPDIPGMGTMNNGNRSLLTSFNLNGAAPGTRDIMITPPGQLPFTLAGAFNVLPAPVACTYTAGPMNASYPAGGGAGDLVVAPSAPSCDWSASTATPWITLLPKQKANVQPYSVAENPDTNQRMGTIMVAGHTVNVTQAGACHYSISPGTATFANTGGTVLVNVTAPAGCAWTAASNAGWIAVTQGAAGTGNGWVTLVVSTTALAARSDSVTIADKIFQALQSGPDCGAVDVSNQVNIERGAMLSNFVGTRYVQQVRLTNTGPPLTGPVFLVIDGLPTSDPPCVGTCEIIPAVPLTFCNSTNGSSLVTAAPTGMTSGQIVTLSLQFTPGRGAGGVPPTWYTTRVLNGTSSH